jgi:hypothetical protein
MEHMTHLEAVKTTEMYHLTYTYTMKYATNILDAFLKDSNDRKRLLMAGEAEG